MPAGATSPLKVESLNPGSADSWIVGTSGSTAERLSVVTASARSLPARMCGSEVRHLVEAQHDVSAHEIDDRGRGALVLDVAAA